MKLTDFVISPSLETSQNFADTFIGSKCYMSPERITGKKYSYSSDLWSLGLVIYELATGEEPYDGGSDFLTQITKIVESPEPRLNSNIFSKEFCNFIELTVKKEDNKRGNIDELLNHPWILMHDNNKDKYSIVKWLAFLYDYDYD